MDKQKNCLSAESASSAVAQMWRAEVLFFAEGNKRWRGALLFGDFPLSKNKATRPKAKKNIKQN